MTFDPKSKLSQIRGKDYLEVKWRIVWFREDHPDGTITTEILSYDPPVIRATIATTDRILGSGIGTPKTQGVASGRPFEGAETAAIGRALAHAGYGTQFTGEDEGEHLADAPITKNVGVIDEAKKLGGVSVYSAVVDAGLAENEHAAKNALAKCKTGYDTVEKAVAWMKIYRGWRDMGLESDPAAGKANNGEQP